MPSQIIEVPEAVRGVLSLYEQFSAQDKLQSVILSADEHAKDLDDAITHTAEIQKKLQAKVK